MTTPDQPTPDQVASFDQTHGSSRRAQEPEPDAHGPYLGAIHHLVYRVRQLLTTDIHPDPAATFAGLAAAADEVDATEAELVASLDQAERVTYRLLPRDDGRARAVHDQLAAAQPGDMFVFEQRPGQRVTVVVARSYAVEQPTTVATWQSAQPGDTPGQLVPGEADTPQPIDAAYERGVAEGRRQATEGWEREWGVRSPAGSVEVRRDERGARRLASYHEGARPVSRLVGPWEPAEQAAPSCTCPMLDVTNIRAGGGEGIRTFMQGLDPACPTCVRANAELAACPAARQRLHLRRLHRPRRGRGRPVRRAGRGRPVSLHEQLLAVLAPDGLIHGCGECGQHHGAEAALRAVVELHPVVSFGRRLWCEPCSRRYPCSTVQAIARELGIEAGEGRG